MRTLTRILLVSGGVTLAGLGASPALAQQDLSPKLPNVLLLIDNSGSMEYLMKPAGMLPGDSRIPASIGSTACDGSTHLAARNRWANLVTALTGTIDDQNFSCMATPRTGTSWVDEFGLPGAPPYDYNYYLPFNRIRSSGCSYGPGKMPNVGTGTWNWWNLPSTDTLNGGADYALSPSGCTFAQSADGLLDAFRSMIRFGMMSLDTLPNPSTGSAEGTPRDDYPGGVRGMWSYFHNWIAGPTCASPVGPCDPPTPSGTPNTNRPAAGNPAGCDKPLFMEVGARNLAAPPWEGRMVPFGPWDSDTHVPTTNDQIQMEILSMRTFGSTPIAGILDDAEEFLFSDLTVDFNDHNYKFAPTDDQYWHDGCRETFVVLFTDGEPNQDMRRQGPFDGCDSAPIDGIAGVCPYSKADTIALRLRSGYPQSVPTFVVGFTTSTLADMNPPASVPSGATDCEKLSANDCVNAPAQLYACCELQKIAAAGGTTQAYFADTPTKLKQSLGAIFSQIAHGTTDRTWPVFAANNNRLNQGANLAAMPTAAYQIAASFAVTAAAPSGGGAVGSLNTGLWTGQLLRERWACPENNTNGLAATLQDVALNLGDNFSTNINTPDVAHPREFFTAVAMTAEPWGGWNTGWHHGHHGTVNGVINSDFTIRPNVEVDDGMGVYLLDDTAPTTPQAASTFISNLVQFPEAFGISGNDIALCKSNFGDINKGETACTTKLLTWEIGGNNILPADKPFATRDWQQCPKTCPGPSYQCGNTATGAPRWCECSCSQLGAIVHSTPVVVGPPSAYVNDESYALYAAGQGPNDASVPLQPTMLYTATQDGQLHAFKVQANDPNDSWTVDKQGNNELWSFFPPRVLKNLLPNYDTGGVPLLDGLLVIADVPGDENNTDTWKIQRSNTSTSVKWRRVLVGSGGPAGGFYYALEITDPTAPRFMWQISTDEIGRPLFGMSTPSAAITIVNIALTPGAAPTQLPVAILPGGTNVTGAGCPTTFLASPHGTTNSVASGDDAENPHLMSGLVAAPAALRCWDYGEHMDHSSGNSVMIVRLDNGEVLAMLAGPDFASGDAGGHWSGVHGHHWGWKDHDKHGGNKHGGGPSTGAKANVIDAPFLAPLSGVPVPYPNQPGQISDRVYIGDSDGLLWRIDLTSPDISDWNAKLAWDTYVDESGGTASRREGISVAPIVSVDAIGNPVILVATGDQDNFNAQQTVNHVWSLTETAANLKVSPNWHIRMPTANVQGPRVTGPMALFGGALYFATYSPPTGSNVCADGVASVWAVDYVQRATVSVTGTPASMSPVIGTWPKPKFPTPSGAPIYGADDTDGRSIIMGVSVSQTPTCDISPTINDPYLGTHTAVGAAGAGTYHVSWQTGAGKGLSTNNTSVSNDAKVHGVQHITAPAPGRATRIDSWAAIVDVE